MSQEKSDELNQNPKPASDVLTNNTHAPDATNYPNAAVNIDKPANDRLVNDESIVNDNLTDSDEPSMPPIPPKEPIPSSDGWSPKKKSYLNLGILIALIVIGVALILYAWKLPPFTPTVQQTNNAFVKGQTTIISPQVSGYVTEVAVKDFATVKEGDLLIKVDDRTFRQQLEQAQANIEIAVTNRASNAQDTGTSQAQIEAREADLYSAKVSVDSAREDVKRYQGLDAIGAVSKAEVAHIKAQLAKAQANVQQAEANLQVAREASEKTSGSRSSLDANIKSAEAGAKQAQINLDNTVISAPESGQLSQISVKEGLYVSAGAANPATGNYIKIAQRVPVRIDLAQNQPNLAQLRPGMSVSVNVDTKAKS
ncbi:HlyD family secretion protein [Psychrobacter sp. YGAH215]|uniref:HlyD family secretion protein n=1 Tax=Psychrobacter sp. YGAH215 TaxID=2596826 RepID=UPI001186310B|nr:HlyD family secretion protein [Psychrobacter sp. YGAH215]TSB24767.1 HlyD family secretion protein [Psychrobacter sp. YGAH215]